METSGDKPIISIEDFAKLDLRVGRVAEAHEVPNSEKLVLLKIVDSETTTRQILAGIKKSYSPETLIGKQILFIANLAPRKLAGLESEGMVLVAHDTEGKFVVVCPEESVRNGSKVS